MAQTLSDVYLYLGRRDKSAVRFLAKFLGREQLATRVDDITPLRLPHGWAEQIEQIIFDSRLEWEPWVESADSFDELRSALRIRGFTNVPTNAQSEFTPANVQTPQVNMNHLPKKITMMRKGG
jgi:hypothetical protein